MMFLSIILTFAFSSLSQFYKKTIQVKSLMMLLAKKTKEKQLLEEEMNKVLSLFDIL
jgi:hypothetical protein